MWCDPSISIDLNFLALLPYLHDLTAAEYPISSKQLKQLANLAVQQFNIKAAVGATILLFLKNNLPNTEKEFPVVHLSNIDRIFYFVSERSITNKSHNQLYHFTKITVRKWFQTTPKGELQKMLTNLKGELNIFEKALQYVNDEKQEKKELSIRILKLFVVFLAKEKKDEEEYLARFKDHGLYIYRNKKQLLFLNVIYQIQFILNQYIHKREEIYDPQYLIGHIEKKLFHAISNKRFSISIEKMAFILRKLFVIKVKNKIPCNIYSQLLLRIEQFIENFFSRIKLSQLTGFYVYHMSHTHFFPFLQSVFDPSNPSQFSVIGRWKQVLSAAVIDSCADPDRDIAPQEIQNAIFILQLRDKSAYLWSDDLKAGINDFPLVRERVIGRVVGLNSSKFSSVQFAVKIVCLVEESKGYELFKKSNIIQKSLFYYYIHYYLQISFSIKEERSKRQLKQTQINFFFTKITNLEVISLIQFYLLEIELGNYHGIQSQSCHAGENTVNQLVYQSLINMLYQRLMSLISEYKRIRTTQQLCQIKEMKNYFIILVRAISPDFQVPYVCRNCVLINQTVICAECEYICVGLKLYSSKNAFNPGRDKYFYREMISNFRQKCEQAYRGILVESEVHNNEWLGMLSMLLEYLIAC